MHQNTKKCKNYLCGEKIHNKISLVVTKTQYNGKMKNSKKQKKGHISIKKM